MRDPLDRVVAVDWSGDRSVSGQRRKIWAGVWTASPKGKTMGGTVTLEGGRTRAELTDWLIEMAAETPVMVVGFDFIFSYPGWFLKEHGVRTMPELWRRVADGQGEAWLDAACADDRFWGKPKKKPAEFCGEDNYRMLRRADVEVKIKSQIAEPAKAARVVGIAPKSPFQIGGAGSVGTASLRGMAHLLTLREAGFAVWPADDPAFPMVVEMYTRLMTGPVNKSSEAARTAYLKERKVAGLSRDVLARARGSEDAFDALVSCLVMTECRAEFPELPRETDTVYKLEGRTWQPGVGR
jgi:hypothetical protein